MLVEFSNAVMADDEARLERARQGVREALGEAASVEVAAVAANFNQMDRIADSTGIPSDPAVREVFTAVGREIGTVEYASAKNTLRLL